VDDLKELPEAGQVGVIDLEAQDKYVDYWVGLKKKWTKFEIPKNYDQSTTGAFVLDERGESETSSFFNRLLNLTKNDLGYMTTF